MVGEEGKTRSNANINKEFENNTKKKLDIIKQEIETTKMNTPKPESSQLIRFRADATMMV